MAEPASKAITMLGGFKLIAKIGQGGMGTVFKARQLSLDRDVALKILPPKIAQSDPVFIERFIREARTSAKLNHPNIVQGIEVGKDDASGLYYFAMELIDGASIKALLKQQRVIEEKRALEIAMGVTQALICAHRAGIVHRDIKPDNILLTSRGEPKLADLGLARNALDNGPDESAGTDDVFGVRLGHAELTQAGSTVGTPSYMSPEQIKAEIDKIDARTDLYAFGATLFHMVTGRAPYVAENSRAVMMLHLTAAVPDARAVNPAVSESVSRLIARLMQKEQNKRVASAEELARELDRIINGAPVERLRRGSGKQLAIRDTGRYGAVGEGGKSSTGDHSANRTLSSGAAAHSANKGTKSHAPVGSRKVLYAGLAVAGVAICGIAITFLSGGGAPVAHTANADQPKPSSESQVLVPTKVSASTESSKAAASLAPSSTEKWEPFAKAMKSVREKPHEYASNIKLLEEAEKGAPQNVVLEIRHERSIVEHDRDGAFRNALDELLRKARESIGGGKADFASALAVLKDGAIPDALLNDANRAEFARVRGEFETQAFTAFHNSAQELTWELEHSAAGSVPKLQALLQKLEPLSKQYPVKAAQEQLAVIRQEINDQILIASGNFGQTQESAFCRDVEAAWLSARGGDYHGAVKTLVKIHADAALAERFGVRADVLKRDLQNIHELQQKSSASKLDAAAQKYVLAVSNFWQGHAQKAYEAFSQIKKETSDGSDAGIYLDFMNFRSRELMAKITECFHEVQNNSALSADAKKSKQAEAQALLTRLKADYAATEAYLARKQKK